MKPKKPEVEQTWVDFAVHGATFVASQDCQISSLIDAIDDPIGSVRPEIIEVWSGTQSSGGRMIAEGPHAAFTLLVRFSMPHLMARGDWIQVRERVSGKPAGGYWFFYGLRINSTT